jgi:mRNA interferase RelE/StbE
MMRLFDRTPSFWPPAVVRALDRLTQAVFLRIDAKIQALSADPRPPDCIKLQGVENLHRIRVGDFRVVYQIKDDELLVLVVSVGDRKDVYRNL